MKNKIGWFSAALIVVGYYLLSANYLTSNDLSYNLLNLIGGTGLAYRVYLDRNYSNFILELIFILIATLKIFNYV